MKFLFFVIPSVLFFFLGPSIAGTERDFFSSNWGYTGLLEIPDARIMKKEMWRANIRQVSPYRFYSLTFTPFEGIELTGRITEIIGVKASSDPKWKGYGNYKDKAVDLKFRLIREEKYLPQIAIGIMDPHGTRLYPSQYVVMSKKIYPLDLTVGFGNGRFGKRALITKGEGFYVEMFQNPKKWLQESKFFSGVRLDATQKLSFVLEYDPTLYAKQELDPAKRKYFSKEPKTKLNVGLIYRPFEWMDLTFAYERGNKLGFGIASSFEIGNPLLPISDKIYKEAPSVKEKSPEERIKICLFEMGFKDIGVKIDDDTLFIDLRNDKYFYLPKAIHVVFGCIYPFIPPYVDKVIITFVEKDIPITAIKAKRSDIALYSRGEISLYELISICEISSPPYLRTEEKFGYEKFIFGFKPQISLYVNDPSGFWKGKLGIVAYGDYKIRDSFTLKLALSLYPLKNVSSTVAPLSIPVRSDIVSYLKKPFWPDMLAISKMGKNKEGVYYRISGGYLEYEYAGVDAEIAKPYFNGRIFAGASGSIVKKRDPKSPFLLKDEDIKRYYAPFFVNLRLNVPEIDTFFDIKGGRFLAGDFGVRIGISKWIKGVTISAWMGITDTSVFKDRFNRGYRDKGISVMIPMRIFEGKESRTVYGYSISPWTRDVAQDIHHPENLFDIIGRNVKKMLDRDIELVY